MKIKSDNIVKLEELYKVLDAEGILVKKEPKNEEDKGFLDFLIVVHTNNIDVELQLSLTFEQVLGTIAFVYGGIQKILIKKPSGEEEIIDAEIIENPKTIENKKKIDTLDIPKDSVLEIIE